MNVEITGTLGYNESMKKITIGFTEKNVQQFKNEVVEEVNSKLLKVKKELSKIYNIPVEQIEAKSLISENENFGLPSMAISSYIFFNKNTNELLNPCFFTAPADCSQNLE